MIIQANSFKIPLADNSVNCITTSPPYWGLRSYNLPPVVFGGRSDCPHTWQSQKYNPSPHGDNGQLNSGLQGGKSTQGQTRIGEIESAFCQLCGAWLGCYGLEPTMSLFVQNSVEIGRELRRVLRSDGTMWWNMGDCYATGKNGRSAADGKAMGNDDRTFRDKPFSTADELPSKNLCMIPARVAIALQDDGWILRRDAFWIKSNAMPDSTDDRPGTAHEYIFMFTKSNKPTFWVHRDLPGARQQPKPDFRWQHVSGIELDTAPAGDWKKELADCPACEGLGKITAEAGNLTFGMVSHTAKCERCAGKGKVTAWERVNLWRGDDYYFDMEAVRKAKAESTTSDPRGNGNGHRRERGYPGSPGNGGTNLGGPTGGRAWRSSDFFFDSLDSHIAHLQDIRCNGGMMLDSEGLPVAFVVNPRGYVGAHYATWPIDLVIPMIKASTSELGVCCHCSAPWVRSKTPTAEYAAKVGSNNGADSDRYGQGYRKHSKTATAEYVTTGWRPSCACTDNVPIPAVILDPFCGSGATGEASGMLARRFIGLDLNPKYLTENALPRAEGKTSQAAMATLPMFAAPL